VAREICRAARALSAYKARIEHQQPIVQEGVIQNPESVLNPKFGQPIRVGQGVDVRGAVGYTAVPFVARESFSMLGYPFLERRNFERTSASPFS